MGQVAASIDGGEQETAVARTVWPQTNGRTEQRPGRSQRHQQQYPELETEAQAGQLRTAFGALAALA